LTQVLEFIAEGWRPVLEIALISSVIYAILVFVRGTRGAGILKGLATVFLIGLVLVMLLAELLDLTVVSWLLTRLAGLSAILIIIIFQPEIRRALVRLGQNPLLKGILRHKADIVEEIVKAVTAMAQKKIGALIAIEREIGIGSYIEGGVRLDANVVSEAIITVFSVNTPLHDGAIIIRKQRIAAAGCLFPLSENPEIVKSLGTRHRAGIGITEESDAVSIIVSEETGSISVGVRGNLTHGVSPSDLRSILRQLCYEAVEIGIATEE